MCSTLLCRFGGSKYLLRSGDWIPRDSARPSSAAITHRPLPEDHAGPLAVSCRGGAAGTVLAGTAQSAEADEHEYLVEWANPFDPSDPCGREWAPFFTVDRALMSHLSIGLLGKLLESFTNC